MKKLVTIALMMVLALNAKADDIFATGYYVQNDQKVAAVYRNGEIIYTVSHEGMNATPKTIVCDANKNIYWMINIYQGTSFKYTEVWKNDLLYVSTQGMSGVRIIDIYCLDDTLYYAGSYTNEGEITVATVWKGTDFTTHWQLGDGEHTSFIYDAEVNPNNGTPYFCGYVTDESTNATVWENDSILYMYEPSDYIVGSSVNTISIDNDSVFTLGFYSLDTGFDTYSFPAIWRNGETIRSFDAYDIVDCLCAYNGDYYYCYTYPHGMQYCLCRNNSTVMQFPFNGSAGVSRICKNEDEIYLVGLLDNKGCIWKNFQVLQQPENCAQLIDMTIVETSNPPDNYYGYLYQPDSAVIYLNPNQPYEANNDQMYAGFRYKSNGLLDKSFVETYLDYGHWIYYYYDADYHIIKEFDSYFNPMAIPYQNNYAYENGLLMTYTRYFNDYHNEEMNLVDSISYSYDEVRRLQTEKRYKSTTYEKGYEYHENQVIITTDGYTNGTWGDWLTLSQETRTFSEDSLLLSAETEKYNDSAVLVTYSYDQQGHKTSVLTQKRNNGVWENQKLVQYNFNPYGRLTLAEIKQWQDDAFVDAHRAVYELNEMGYPAVVTFEKWDGEAWVTGVWQPEFYLFEEDHLKQHNDLLSKYKSYVNKIEMTYLVTENPREPILPNNSEWYYEIQNNNGSITYQHLECVADTTIGNEHPKIIIRSNTHYDRDIWTEVTHEYVYEENGIVYWWNKDLEEFTTLYNLNANIGDEWTIKIGYDSLFMHVDGVENIENNGRNYRVLHVSDADNLFGGDIVCGVGHMTSFFPERLMRNTEGFRVEGLRCYWVGDELVYHEEDEDCDAIYAELHNGIEEKTDDAAFAVYPNPAHNVLFVEPQSIGSQPTTTYRITNLMGQTVLSGSITVENQQINVEALPAGMYFITLGDQTIKFVKQ